MGEPGVGDHHIAKYVARYHEPGEAAVGELGAVYGHVYPAIFVPGVGHEVADVYDVIDDDAVNGHVQTSIGVADAEGIVVALDLDPGYGQVDILSYRSIEIIGYRGVPTDHDDVGQGVPSADVVI
ncbi:hypothetical protein DSECCO2_384850 [anaerobic digester metagenome]